MFMEADYEIVNESLKISKKHLWKLDRNLNNETLLTNS